MARKGAARIPMIEVWPRDPLIAQHLKHQPSRQPLNTEGSTFWPADQFTYRRIEDGDLLTSAPFSYSGA